MLDVMDCFRMRVYCSLPLSDVLSVLYAALSSVLSDALEGSVAFSGFLGRANLLRHATSTALINRKSSPITVE